MDPADDPLFPVQLGLRYLHIFGAIALMGGTIFMRLALLPTLKSLEGNAREPVHEGVRARWKMVVRIAAVLLLVSGIANLGLAARYDYHVPHGLSYSMLGGIKLILALPIFLLAELLLGKSSLAQKVQANAVTVLNINLALAVILVLIGGWLKFSDRELKAKYRQGDVPPPASAREVGVPASSGRTA
jgi:hypothetical protein